MILLFDAKWLLFADCGLFVVCCLLELHGVGCWRVSLLGVGCLMCVRCCWSLFVVAVVACCLVLVVCC